MVRTITLATLVGFGLLASAERATAEVKVLPSVTGSGVTVGFTIKPGVYPPAGYPYPVYPGYGYPGYGYPGYGYPGYGSPVYPGVIYPAPVYVPVAPAYTVWVRGSIYEPWRLHGSFRSHSFAHEMADGLMMAGYHAKVMH